MNETKQNFSWVKKEAMKHGLTLKEFFKYTSFKSYNYMVQILNNIGSIPENAQQIIDDAFAKISYLKNSNSKSIVQFNVSQPYFGQISSGKKKTEIRPVSVHWLERLIDPVNYMYPLDLEDMEDLFKNPFITYSTVDEIFKAYGCRFKAFDIITIRNGFARKQQGYDEKKIAPFIVANWEGISIKKVNYPITGKNQYCFITEIGDIIKKETYDE